jgi:hypothetical protein
MNELFPEQELRSMGTPSIIVFDVNETLIDIESIDHFSRENSATGVLREWFN